MNLTINFILLFLIIIFPGIVFRRFYFYGDFSKQFKIKEPLNNLFISNIIPGVILLVTSLVCISLFEEEAKFVLLTNIFFLDKENIDNDFLKSFLVIIGVTLSLAILSGYSIARIIRLLKLDIRIKILQFKNTWHYVFSGEISRFRKFKGQFDINIRNKRTNSFYPPYVDILITKGSGDVLYSGFLLDYEVDHGEVQQLDKVYLKRPKRYRKKEDGTTELKEIPGDLFVLNTQGMINLNIYYPVLQEQKKEKDAKNGSWKKYMFLIFMTFNVIIGLGYFLTLFFNTGCKFYDLSNWYQKLFIVAIITQVVSFFIPEKTFDKSKNKNFYKYTWGKFIFDIIITLIIGIVYWFLIK